MKYFTEREFSGIFSLAGGNFASSKREFPVALVPWKQARWTGLETSNTMCRMVSHLCSLSDENQYVGSGVHLQFSGLLQRDTVLTVLYSMTDNAAALVQHDVQQCSALDSVLVYKMVILRLFHK